jgi:HlyD family secretion protein
MAMILRAPILLASGLALLATGLIAGGSLGNNPDIPVKAWLARAVDGSEAGTGKPVVEPIAGPVGVGALGRVEPASRVRRISPPGSITMNRVDRLFVAEGDNVTAGQLLAEFADAATKHAAVAQADAGIAEAQTELARVRAAGRPEDIEAERERIVSLRYQEAITKSDADRADALVPSGAGARAVAERADAAANRATANLREAEARLASLSTPRPEDIAVAEAKLQSAMATSERARGEAALSQVFAPIAGKILRIYARPGDLVGSDGLLELANLDQLEVVADVYETDLPRVHIGARADVTVPGTSTRYPAQVREVGWLVRRGLEAGTDPIAAVDARTVEVRLRLGADGAADLRQRINAQVHVAIQP